jgi:tetratricopeptide (TPR) repeat protein
VIGQTVSHYRLTDQVGTGGMGTVYKADDLKLERVVAVKIVTPHHSNPETAVKRFIREAKIVSKIGHPNVITVHDIVEEDNVNYLVMEYIDGKSLRQRMSEPLELPNALRIATDIASGLDAAHRLGVVHRDIKPENIMITKSGLSKVLDFGVAQLADTTKITSEGAVVGTAHYMAPEQLRGQPTDGRTDIYALGVVLFEMLSGRRPFDARGWEALRYQVMTKAPPSLRTLVPSTPDDVDAIVRKALAKDPGERYESMEAMLHDLRIVRERLSAELAGVRKMHARKRLRRRARIWVALAVSLGVLLALWRWIPRPPDTGRRILVMQAANTLADNNIDYLSGGIMDGLITALSRLVGYNVITRETVTTTMDATNIDDVGFAPAQVLAVAAELGAEYVVLPRFAQKERTIRVDCELRKVGHDASLGSWWQDISDLKTDFYPAIGRLAADVAFALGAEWPEDEDQSPVAITHSIEALRHYQRALDRYERRDLVEAVAELRLAVRADTTFAAAYLRLARLSPDRDEQKDALQRAMIYRHGAPQPVGRLILASQLEWDNQLEEAIRTFRSILADYPTNVEARRSLAKLLMYRRRFGEAAAEFSVLKTMNPYDYSFYGFWWIALSHSRRTGEALSILEAWRDAAPDEPGPLRRLISHQLTFGNYDEIEPLLGRLAELSPRTEPRYRAALYLELGRMNEARELYEAQLTSSSPGSAPGRSYSNLAWLYYYTGDYEKGLEYAQRALAAAPDAYNSWIAGLLAAANGQPDIARTHTPAIKEYFTESEDEAEVVEALSERRYYYHLLGEIALAEQDPQRAVEMHRLAVRFCSHIDRPFFGTYLALAFLAAGDQNKAVAELDSVVSINPNYPPALLYLGRTYVERDRYDLAKEVLLRLKQVWRQADRDYRLNQELSRLLTLVDE